MQLSYASPLQSWLSFEFASSFHCAYSKQKSSNFVHNQHLKFTLKSTHVLNLITSSIFILVGQLQKRSTKSWDSNPSLSLLFQTFNVLYAQSSARSTCQTIIIPLTIFNHQDFLNQQLFHTFLSYASYFYFFWCCLFICCIFVSELVQCCRQL